MGRGVPRGYRHDWHYWGRWRERKVKPRQWRFDFRARKSRHVSARGLGSMPVGSKIRWRIVATQEATKVGRNQYSTRMVGRKELVSVRR